MHRFGYLLLPVLAYIGLSFMAWDFSWVLKAPIEEPASFLGRFILLAALFAAVVSMWENWDK